MLSNTSEKLGDSPWAMLVTAEPATFPAGTLKSAPEQQAPWDTERLMSPKALGFEEGDRAGRDGRNQEAQGSPAATRETACQQPPIRPAHWGLKPEAEQRSASQ